jgi:hypothetical protein
MGSDDYAEERQALLETVERDEHELREAVDDLKRAVTRPLEIVEEIADRQPAPVASRRHASRYVARRAPPANDLAEMEEPIMNKSNPRQLSAARDRVVDGLSHADGQIRSLARQRPFIAFGGALLLGYIVGRIARS